MTVKELIERLQALAPEAPVHTDYDDILIPCKSVDVESDEGKHIVVIR